MSGTTQQLPVFVYGTLRPGQPNWDRLLAGLSEKVAAGRLGGVDLLDCNLYPAAVERPGAAGAVGDVVWIRPEVWLDVLAALDHLEGYDPANPEPLFVREVRAVEVPGGPVDCWVYLAGPNIVGSSWPVVESADWVVHCDGRPGYHARWESIARSGGRADPEP